MVPTLPTMYLHTILTTTEFTTWQGNVNEWVADVYRPLSPFDVEEFHPYRGNIITENRKDSNGNILFDKYGEAIKDTIADYRNSARW